MASQEACCKILQLSDCTLMCILEYLDATSLYMLSRTCLYFKNIIEDPRLWRYVDARAEPNKTKKVDYVVDKVHGKTTHLMIRALNKEEGLISHEVLLGFGELQNLTVLALENQKFDGRKVILSQFPGSLTELSLRKTFVKYSKTFFHRSSTNMKNLRVLILDECSWIEGHVFMSIAKYPRLEILSIIKCFKLHVNVIAYLTIARKGFQRLKLMDSRLNTIANDLLIQPLSQIRAMYFQSMRSYQLDTGKLIAKPTRTFSPEEINEYAIRNDSLRNYPVLVAANLVEELPQSVLYQDPYPDCTCGSTDRRNEPPIEEFTWNIPLHDDFIDHRPSPTSFICRRHVDDLRSLPKEFRTFFTSHQKQPIDSDDDSDSDDDCCMFGTGRTQQMIVLKLRDVETGNVPVPQVIELNRMMNIDLNPSVIVERLQTDEPHLQPSTSREVLCYADPPERRQNHLPTTTSNLVQPDAQPSSSKKQNSQSCDPVPSSSKPVDPQPSCSRDIDPQPSCSTTNDHAKSNGFAESKPGPSGLKQNDDPIPGPSRSRYPIIPDSDAARMKADPREAYEESQMLKMMARPPIFPVSIRRTWAVAGSSKRKTENQNFTPSKRLKTDNGNGEGDNEAERGDDEGERRNNEGAQRINDGVQGDVEDERDNNGWARVDADGAAHRLTNRVYQCGMILDESALIGRGHVVRLNRNQEDPKRAGPTNLRRLSLRGYRGISDVGLRFIKHLNLDLLDVTHTQVTKQGIERFLIDNPNCRIIHRDYCICKPRIPI